MRHHFCQPTQDVKAFVWAWVNHSNLVLLVVESPSGEPAGVRIKVCHGAVSHVRRREVTPL